MKPRTLTIPATYEALEELKPFITLWVMPASEKLLMHIVLAVHELCANIVEHAYKGASGEIYVEADRDERRLKFIIRDWGPNGYTPPEEIIAPDPLSLPEGGWGIYILHEVMDKVEYRRVNATNEWLLEKMTTSWEVDQ